MLWSWFLPDLAMCFASSSQKIKSIRMNATEKEVSRFFLPQIQSMLVHMSKAPQRVPRNTCLGNRFYALLHFSSWYLSRIILEVFKLCLWETNAWTPLWPRHHAARRWQRGSPPGDGVLSRENGRTPNKTA